jgi:ATP-binding cassette, subfamily B, bacterial
MGGQMTQASAAIWHVANGISAAVMFLALAVSAFLLSAPVALGIMSTAAVLFVCLRPLSKRMRRRSAATSSALVSQATSIAESVRMAEEVQVFGIAAWERSRVISLVKSLEGHFVQTRFLSRIVPAVYQGVLIVLIVASLAILYAIGTEGDRLAALGAVVLLLVRASNYGQAIQVAYQGVGESVPYIERVARATSRYVENVRDPGHRALDSVQAIEFQSVSFEYRSESPVLQGVSFSIRAGEAIGVVGPSGAGKSTLVQLLLRLRDPVSGSYLVNGISAKEVDDVTWHHKVSYLPQEPHLLNATVAENIRFFRDWVEDDAVESAARLAQVHHDIATWPDGYLTTVGHRANSLSGGQIQRLCLARALAGAPQVLILDEPTSSLDLHSEQLIQESLQGLRGTLTLIVVAHRLTTLSLCDRVMVIRGGRLEAFAPPAPLYNSNDYYRRAVDLAGVGKPL